MGNQHDKSSNQPRLVEDIEHIVIDYSKSKAPSSNIASYSGPTVPIIIDFISELLKLRES